MAVRSSKVCGYRCKIQISHHSYSARHTHSDAIFVFLPGNQAGFFERQYAERELDKSGIKLIGDEGITDDDLLGAMGDEMIGIITSGSYSPAHVSEISRAFVDGFIKFHGSRPNYVVVSAWDGTDLIYRALTETGDDINGDKLIAAMRGMIFESLRGPITIDPATRDIVQNIYNQACRAQGWEAVQYRVWDLPGSEGSRKGRRQVIVDSQRPRQPF